MSIRTMITGLAVLLVAAAGIVALNTSGAAALSASDYMSRLERNGYSVTPGSAVVHATLKVDGKLLIIEQHGRKATVEILDYGSFAKLQEDWKVVNGEGPEPKVATKDFDGKILYWNNDSVLAVDYSAPNDSLLARAAANAYLGRSGTGGNQPSPTPGAPTATPGAGSPTPTPGTLPPTGGPPASSSDGNALAIAIAIVAVVLVPAGVGLAYRGARS